MIEYNIGRHTLTPQLHSFENGFTCHFVPKMVCYHVIYLIAFDKLGIASKVSMALLCLITRSSLQARRFTTVKACMLTRDKNEKKK